MSQPVPFLSRITVFPIKSLDGVELESAPLLPSGALAHDRTWALFDAGGGFVNGKRCAAVHRLRSAIDVGARRATLHDAADPAAAPQVFDLDGDRGPIEAWLRRYFGFPVDLRRNDDLGFPDDTDSPGPTVISVATLQEIGRWFGLPIDSVRGRLRTNLEIDGVPPFWEDRLFGPAGTVVRFRVGAVGFEGINPCQRCVVPARDPMTGANDDTFVRRFTERRSQTFPEWSTRARFNHAYRVAINTRLSAGGPARMIRVGDPIEILDAPAETPSPVRVGFVAEPASFWSGQLIVDSIRDETPTVRTFRLRGAPGGALPFAFLPGQFLTITVGMDAGPVQRCYTIASSPSERQHCEITVKREGAASTALHETLKPGARLDVSGPSGRFVFDGSASERVVFLAGGVGITPLMSKLRFLADARWHGQVDLIYSVRDSRDIIFRQELADLQTRMPGLRVHVTVTGPDREWDGPRGRLTQDWVRTQVPDIARRHVRLCGPTALATSAQALLRELGVPASQVAIEAFGGRSESPVSDGRSHNMRFLRSEIVATVGPGQTLLDAALAAGVSIDHGCRAGVCGRCRARLVEGDVTIDCDFVLGPEDKTEGLFLTCQARPVGDVVIDR